MRSSIRLAHTSFAPGLPHALLASAGHLARNVMQHRGSGLPCCSLQHLRRTCDGLRCPSPPPSARSLRNQSPAARALPMLHGGPPPHSASAAHQRLLSPRPLPLEGAPLGAKPAAACAASAASMNPWHSSAGAHGAFMPRLPPGTRPRRPRPSTAGRPARTRGPLTMRRPGNGNPMPSASH